MLHWWVLLLLAALVGLGWFSDKATDTAAALALMLEISPMIIGLGLVSVGTSIPEISNSIVSSYRGHGDIVTGDNIGSTIAQLTLTMALVVFVAGEVEADKKDILLFGGTMLLAAIIGVMVVQTGSIGRGKALLLILSYFVMALLIRKYALHDYYMPPIEKKHHVHLWKLAFYMLGVAGSAALVVESTIRISDILGIPEFVIAFILVSLGTSLPELAIRISAIKKGHHEIAVGDIFGSNIADMTLGLGSGPLLFPIEFSARMASGPGWYLIFVTILVVALFAKTRKIDLPFAVLLVLLYLLSFAVAGIPLVLPELPPSAGLLA